MGPEAQCLTRALKAPTPHEPVTRLAEQARRVVAFHVPPATAFLMRLPGTTSTDLGRPDRTDLRGRDEKADRSDASSRRIGRPLPAEVQAVLDRPAVLVVRSAFRRQQRGAASFFQNPRLGRRCRPGTDRLADDPGSGAVAAQDLVQAPFFQVLLSERDDRRRNLVAHQGERYVAH
jgi:hypothetical protein